MKCPYCKKRMELKRFIDTNYQGELLNERFVFVCEKCKIVISPKLITLACCESEKEKQILRDLYFKINPPEIEKKNAS